MVGGALRSAGLGGADTLRAVELVLAEYTLRSPGGAQTYLATAASHLEQLGHRVSVLTLEDGPFAQALRGRGFRVGGIDSLPERCDAILSQDAVCAYELAGRYPGVPQLYVVHSAEYQIELPPQVPGTVRAVVAMNDRTARRVQAAGLPAEVIRLRQPIDFLRFRAGNRRHAGTPQAVLLGNALKGPRRELLLGALADAGIAWRQPGASGEGMTLAPETVLADADIVIGYGRSVLEGMSAGCAAYVYDLGLDGWVTPESYAAIEADGFAGTATDGVATRERLATDLAAFDSAIGVAARELVVTHHSPFAHATALAETLGRLAGDGAPVAGPGDAAGELARLARRQWESERWGSDTASHLFARTEELLGRIDVLVSERDLARGETAAARADAEAARTDAHGRALELSRAAADLAALWERTHAAEAELERLRGQRRHRLVARALAPLDRIRARWRR